MSETLLSLLIAFNLISNPTYVETLPLTIDQLITISAFDTIQEQIIDNDIIEEQLPYIYTTESLNLRTGPGTEYDIVYTVPKETQLIWTSIINYEWISIDVNGYEYYVSAKYTTNKKPEHFIALESLEPVLYSMEKNGEKIIFQKDLGEYTLTAYCACEKCCGKWSKYKKTASGTSPEQGRTVACVSLDFGTVINIHGEEYIVEDRGNLQEKQIDIYFESHEEACKFGRQKGTVYLVEEVEKDK